MIWNRPIPLVGDQTSAAERAAEIQGWAFPDHDRNAFYDIVGSRRDVRRFRPDPVDPEIIQRVLTAAHMAPSVGHSQPWRFILVADPATREQAARMADEQRLRQARQLDADSARRLLDLQLEGIREAPLGVVVACDRRTAATGVLGRATFPDADMWSCACAIQNLWLAARAEGLGVGWVTLFEQQELQDLVGTPEGVETLGWLCLGWPDERPPAPGLERAGWSRRMPVDDVIHAERWSGVTPAPASHLRAPDTNDVVGVRDTADVLLTPPGSLGLLDRCVDRVEAAAQHRQPDQPLGGELIVVAGRHLITRHNISAYRDSVTEDVLAASRVGESAGAVVAAAAGLDFSVVDAGTSTGDVVTADALSTALASELIALGQKLGEDAADNHLLVALGEVGIGNTTVASTLAAALLNVPADEVTGLGAGADADMIRRKIDAIERALQRTRPPGNAPMEPIRALTALGGPEFCVLTGIVLGAASRRSVVVLDGLATSVAALAAVRIEPGAAAFLVAGQRSRERAHSAVLEHLGLEPILDLRMRVGEGVGAALATNLLTSALAVRHRTGRTAL